MKNYIVDTTLRDGEQTPGVIFKKQHKLDIAAYLDEIGIEEAEIGTPAMGKHELNVMKEIVAKNFRFKTISWCRALKEDIELAHSCGTDAVSISFPVSQIQLKALGKKESWVLSQIPELIAFAKERFRFVYVGMQDATRAEQNFLIQAIRVAFGKGADRVRIADTVGILNPIQVTQLFTDLSREFPEADFEFHAHNDLGMATANAFTARAAGACGLSGTLTGLGERAGNMAIEEIIMAEYLNNTYVSKYNTQKINKVCNYVAAAARLPIPKCKPVVGENAFAHETGIHVKSVLSNKMSYQAFDESLVGAEKNRIVVGKHSGKAAIAHFFQMHDKYLTAAQLNIMQDRLQEYISLRGKAPNERYLINLYKNLTFTPGFYHV